MLSKQCVINKHPCKYCLQSVTRKNGLQCRGACKKWAHYKCLNYTPGKISDIKAGVIQVLCPCPDCESRSPKEIVVDPPFICDNIKCPAHKLPMCESDSCPSKQISPTLNEKQSPDTCGLTGMYTPQNLNIEPYQPETCGSDTQQPSSQEPCYVEPSPSNSNCSSSSLRHPSIPLECCELKPGLIETCPLQPCTVKSCNYTPKPCIERVNSQPCTSQQCPARPCPLHNTPPYCRKINQPKLPPVCKNQMHPRPMPACPIPPQQCMTPEYEECDELPTCPSRQRNSASSSLMTCDDSLKVMMGPSLSDSHILAKQASMAGHIRDMNCTLDKLTTQMKFLMEKMERKCM